MLLQTLFALTSIKSGDSQTLNAFEIVLIGFLFVFCILIALTLVTSILGKIFAQIPAQDNSTANNVVSKPLPTPNSPSPANIDNNLDIEDCDPHYIAVIAAAIHCAMAGHKYRIVSIRSSNTSWAAEGRRQIFSSHNVR